MREGLDGKVENFNQLPQEVQVAAIIKIITTITIIIPDKIIMTTTIIGSTHSRYLRCCRELWRAG